MQSKRWNNRWNVGWQERVITTITFCKNPVNHLKLSLYIPWLHRFFSSLVRLLIFTIKKRIKKNLLVVLISMLDQTPKREHLKISNISMMLPSRNSMKTSFCHFFAHFFAYGVMPSINDVKIFSWLFTNFVFLCIINLYSCVHNSSDKIFWQNRPSLVQK